ncbi:MAG: type II toxin-antitoxin system YafQ family toxin [Methylococcales symbiont of Hymedesmia sp. n. MRB-2018]|nr:MAG: type II toxin-antitoxin system YafQ family toxin [Methylococcales symbiont of Hymedesmia sp. n. MRB-2018]KAF3983096.1 MAG: type II toxin-antitoxin system YafQ family toxin [Methylococcales symbiont of Hymedesmia sp. n. MRB-2018]
MLKIRYTNQFKKDFKKVQNLPLPDLKTIFEVISTLEKNLILDKKYKDHALSGDWAKFHECHIKPDLLLIYKANSDELQLARLGYHSDLF